MPDRSHLIDTYAELAALCQWWMEEHQVERADRIPYGALITYAGREVALGRRIAAARLSYTRNRMAPEAIAELEALPHWSWSAQYAHTGPQRTVAERSRRYAELWLEAQGIDRADLIPGSATLDLPDGTTFPLGENLRRLRKRYAANALTPEEIELIESLPGWDWTPPRKRAPGQRRNSARP